MFRAEKGGRTSGGRGGRSVTRSGAAGVERDVVIRSRAKIHRAQGWVVESGVSGPLSMWTGSPRPEKKEWNQVHKERCSSVLGWSIRGGVRTRRVKGKDPGYSWKNWDEVR